VAFRKSIVRAAFAALALSAASLTQAADLSGPYPPAGAPVLYAPFTWTGFYIGGNLGAGFATANATASAFGVSASGSETLTGFIGGGQAGFNWQAGPAVLGLEADFQGANQTNSATIGPFSTSEKITYFGTVRGRVGIAFDRWLPYFTAGWGQGGWSTTASLAGVGAVNATSTHDFWTVGGGIEYAFWGNASVKLEYLYLDTGTITTAFPPLALSSRIQDNIVRGGINYRF
jgi:outer membrane immunogenic protein